jgi:hypothetical protein
MLTLSGKVLQRQSIIGRHAAFFITWGFASYRERFCSFDIGGVYPRRNPKLLFQADSRLPTL